MSQRKKFSIFGDSLSLLQSDRNIRHDVEQVSALTDNCEIESIDHMWWGIVVAALGGELLDNDSFSECMVSSWHPDKLLYPSGASKERIDGLCACGISDYLMIYLGTTDCIRSVGVEDHIQPWWKTFSGAYDHMLCDIRRKLPYTKIWCLNITYSRRMRDCFPTETFERMVEYNTVISRAASRYDAKLIDLWTYASNYSSKKVVYPDRNGMETIAFAVLKSINSDSAGLSTSQTGL